MIKKIAILAILITIFIVGNLMASPTPSFWVWVWAQEELTWTLKVEGEPPITQTGNWNNEDNDWCGRDWEIWVFGEKKLYGTFPYYYIHYDIVIPICIPSNEDPEE